MKQQQDKESKEGEVNLGLMPQKAVPKPSQFEDKQDISFLIHSDSFPHYPSQQVQPSWEVQEKSSANSKGDFFFPPFESHLLFPLSIMNILFPPNKLWWAGDLHPCSDSGELTILS